MLIRSGHDFLLYFCIRGTRIIRKPPGAIKKRLCAREVATENILGGSLCRGCMAARLSERHDASLLDSFSISRQCRANRRRYRLSCSVLIVQKFFLILFEVWFEKSVTIKVNELFYYFRITNWMVLWTSVSIVVNSYLTDAWRNIKTNSRLAFRMVPGNN